MTSTEEALAAARRAHRAGELDWAESAYGDVLRIRPDEPTALQYLGMIRLRQGRAAEAVDLIGRALAIGPATAAAHCNFGSALQAVGRLDDAERHFRSSVELNAADHVTHANLGNLLALARRPAEAEVAYRRAIELQPEFSDGHRYLALLFRRQGRFDEAAQSLARALTHRPRDADALNELGLVAREFGLVAEAESLFGQALAARPTFAAARVHLGNVLRDQARTAEAEAAYRQAIQDDPKLVEAHINLGAMLEQDSRLDEAANEFREALRARPGDSLLELRQARIVRQVFENSTIIDRYRGNLLETLHRLADAPGPRTLADVAAYGAPPPLGLMFHGRDDRPIKQAYARVFQAMQQERPPARRDGPPRVGFVVTRGHEGVFLRCMAGVLERLSANELDVLVLCARSGQERLRGGIQSRAIRALALPGRLDLAAESVRAAACDILYYWEVGTDPLNYFLPLLRPALVQCTGWGVPETSGLPTMDAYLSSDLVEPAGAEAHYTESLLRSDSLATYQKRVALPGPLRSRESFGLPTDRHVYLCAQQLGKIHPDFDPVLAEILRTDPRGLVVLVEDRAGRAAADLRRRFAITIPDVADRMMFVPRQSSADYFHLLLAADVLLDPIHCGGGLTAYDGFSLNKPIVTWPGPFARGRYVAACYRKMGIKDGVADDLGEYPRLAFALGTEVDRRRHLMDRIAEASPTLFEDTDAPREFESHLVKLAQRARE